MQTKTYNIKTRTWDDYVEPVELKPEYNVGDWVMQGVHCYRIAEVIAALGLVSVKHPNGFTYELIALRDSNGEENFEKTQMPYRVGQTLKYTNPKGIGRRVTIAQVDYEGGKIKVDYASYSGVSDWVDPLEFTTI